MTGSDLVIVVPMLGRPHRIGPLLESIDSTAADARVLFALSPEDRRVIRAVEAREREYLLVPYDPPGDYAKKINSAYRNTTEPLIFCGADDLKFHSGWFEAAIAHLEPGIGVVGTNDLGSPRVIKGEHSTHSLVTRRYADRYGTIDKPGEILHEGYVHEWVDDELVGTAKHRKAWAFAADSLVEHLHPSWNPNVPTDALYQQQRRRMQASRQLYEKRRQLWT